MILPSEIDLLTGNFDIWMETPHEIYQQLIADYGQDIADNAYKMAALETGHFKSWGWKEALNQGMESFASEYPWGWKEMQSFWDDCPDYQPWGTKDMTEAGTGATITYLEFPTPEASFYTLAEWLKLNNNDPSKWNPGEADYITRVNSIKLPNS